MLTNLISLASRPSHSRKSLLPQSGRNVVSILFCASHLCCRMYLTAQRLLLFLPTKLTPKSPSGCHQSRQIPSMHSRHPGQWWQAWREMHPRRWRIDTQTHHCYDHCENNFDCESILINKETGVSEPGKWMEQVVALWESKWRNQVPVPCIYLHSCLTFFLIYKFPEVRWNQNYDL